VASVKRNGQASHGNVKRTIEALTKMGHRTGRSQVREMAPAIQTDIPRRCWKPRRLEEAGLIGDTVNRPYFTVAHILSAGGGGVRATIRDQAEGAGDL
jgi:glutamate synthase (NADPH/NADH) large chain